MFKSLTMITTAAILAIGLAASPAAAQMSVQHSGQASGHGGKASGHASAAGASAAATVVAVPVVVVGGAIALTGSAMAEIGDGALKLGSNMARASDGPSVQHNTFIIVPDGAPRLD